MVKLRLDRLDKMLIAGASLTALAAFYLLFIDATSLSQVHGQNQEVIGKVVKRSQDVRRRLNQSLVWNELRADDLLFESDSIFTGPKSGVEIKIGDNQKIKIDPNSLIFLEKAPEGLVLDLQLGTISTQLAATETVRIKQGSEIATIQGEDASFRISRNREKKLEFSSHESELEFKLGDQTLILRADESLSLQGGEPIQKTTSPIKLLSPVEGQVIWDMNLAEFRWSGETDRALYIEIDDSIDFEQPLYSELVEGNAHRVEELQAGEIYYWRLVLDQGGTTASMIRRFEIAKAQAPNPLFPPNKFDSTLNETSKELLLTWTPVAHSEGYEVLISRNPEFSNPQRFEATEQFVTHAFDEGQYYWKVRSRAPIQLSHLWSDVRTFSLRNQSLLAEQKLPSYFPAPESENNDKELAPQQETALEQALEETIAELSDSTSDQVPETKIPEPETLDKEVQVKKEEPIQKVVEEPRKPAAIPPLPHPSLTLPAPGTKILSMHDQNELLIFEWTAIDGASEYELQFAKDEKFERLYSTIRIKTKNWIFNGKPPKGSLYWRVRALESENRISKWSESGYVQVLSYQTDKEQ